MTEPMTGPTAVSDKVERWAVHELALPGPADGNPFADVELRVTYRFRNRVVTVDGFYDGDGVYRARFMPDREGRWEYVTSSSAPELDGHRGELLCTPPGPGNHGPVGVHGAHHFAYADGTRYDCIGTTCYHWTYESQELQELTLEGLRGSPFDKVRMCLLPTNGMRPDRLPFVGNEPGQVDVSRFDVEFFRHFEGRVADLLALGIQADLILFHPYDKGFWGFDGLTPEQDAHFLKYVVARLGAYRNVWWSLSNEYDFNRNKTIADWDRLLQLVQRHDPYQRLRSIHNGTKMYEIFSPYDFTKPWITHQSVQHWDGGEVGAWRACPKPVVLDEIGYEGNAGRRWGNLTAQELVHRFWQGMTLGGYVGHGESFVDRETRAWISIGGRLYGESSPRLAFLRDFMAGLPRLANGDVDPARCVLHYVGDRQPASVELDLPADAEYRVELIDTFAMTVEEVPGRFRGRSTIPLPQRPYLVLRGVR
ncbi:uncharacterized protein DUF4038 [Kribbella amoyensis]|uniref:Uncharacterized protein DUF4038 n=1 Tax=Kribbella amoyensis TaxID=996641 RepID=A0A561B8P7_9ACTN|nr:DUF5060 domain-containing protein [Kribbella amoyensis]TWD75169.1 uncharacterized protein DUF4038 [Kribbella amoyensis]